MTKPDAHLEIQLFQEGFLAVCGVDEVGRGPLAGPVVAAAVMLPSVLFEDGDGLSVPHVLNGIDDSKRLTHHKRHHLLTLIRSVASGVYLGLSDVCEIDRLNIRQASLLAMRRAVSGLFGNFASHTPPMPDSGFVLPEKILADFLALNAPVANGSNLSIPQKVFALIDGRDCPENLPCPAKSIIKGDQLSVSIAAASIVAKEARDCMMAALDQHYPGYGWSNNCGYPTAQHRQALKVLGVCQQHRRSFAPVRAALNAG